MVGEIAESCYQRGIAIKPSPLARVPTEYVRLWHKADIPHTTVQIAIQQLKLWLCMP